MPRLSKCVCTVFVPTCSLVAICLIDNRSVSYQVENMSRSVANPCSLQILCHSMAFSSTPNMTAFIAERHIFDPGHVND